MAEGPKVRTNLVDEISLFWEPGFIQADGVLGGCGVTRRKQAALAKFGNLHGRRVFEVPIAAVDEKIKTGLDRLRPGFDYSLTRLLRSLRLQSRLFTRKITQTGTTTEAPETPSPPRRRFSSRKGVKQTDEDSKTQKKTIKGKKTARKPTGGKAPKSRTFREKLMSQVRAACSEWSKAWCSQDFQNLENRPDESVPREWSFGRELSPIEDSSDSESEDEAPRKTIKVEEDAIIVIGDNDDVDMDAKEEDVLTEVKEEDDAGEERLLVS